MKTILRQRWLVFTLIVLGSSAQAIDVTCPGTPPAAPPVGVCAVTSGNATLRLQGDVLGPDGVLNNGQVIIGSNGLIACVGCDCSAHPDYTMATRIECPQGVISPGLIDAMNRLSFSHNVPAPDSGERFEQRHDWRAGQNSHNEITVLAGATTDERRWGELRALMAGTTSVHGAAGSVSGFTRGLDNSTDAAALGGAIWRSVTFPLGDSDGDELQCPLYNYATASPDIETRIVAEGIAQRAENEWLCMTGQWTPPPPGPDRIEAEPLLGIGAMNATTADQARVRGASIVWTPRYNVRLYGDPGPVTLYRQIGLQIALGSNWTATGSMNMLRELQCADALNQSYLDQRFSDRELWQMATLQPSLIGGFGNAIGKLALGLQGDIAIFNAQVREGYRAVIDAGAGDVVLVLRAGLPMNGDATVLTALGHGSCDDVGTVCGVAKKACVFRESGNTQTLVALSTLNASNYPLSYCGTPSNEPSCVPARVNMTGGAATYSGTITAGDSDGDGIANASDNCALIFNPVRPMDAGVQADVDSDGIGDVCDACPLVVGTTACNFVFSDGFE